MRGGGATVWASKRPHTTWSEENNLSLLSAWQAAAVAVARATGQFSIRKHSHPMWVDENRVWPSHVRITFTHFSRLLLCDKVTFGRGILLFCCNIPQSDKTLLTSQGDHFLCCVFLNIASWKVEPLWKWRMDFPHFWPVFRWLGR